MNFKLIQRMLLCVTLLIAGQSALAAQFTDTLVMVARTAVLGRGGTLQDPIALGDGELIVMFIQKRSLCFIDLTDLTSVWLETTPSLKDMDYFFPAAADSGVVARLRSDPLGRTVRLDTRGSVLVQTPTEVPDLTGYLQHYTPLLGFPQSRFSLDLGVSFFETMPSTVALQHDRQLDLGDSTLMFESLTDRRKYVWLADSSPRLLITPFRQNSNTTTRMSARSAPLTMYTIVRPTQTSRQWNLAIGTLGDTTLTRIDTLLVNGTHRTLRPHIVSNMWADSVFYADSAGWQCILTPTGNYSVECPIRVDEVRSEREWLYVFSYDADSIRVAFTSRSQYPQWTTWSVHADFSRLRHEYHPFAIELFGRHGISLTRASSNSMISSPKHPYPLAFGAMLASLDNLPLQRMLCTWTDDGALPMAIDDYGRVLRRDLNHTTKPTYVTYPGLLFDERTNVNAFIDDLDGPLPWFGVRAPQPWQVGGTDTLAHSGSVVRRLLSRGDVQDTVWRGFTTAFARIDASTWSVANHDALWVRTGADTVRHELAPLRTATSLLPGYPSSITPLGGAGRLLLSFYGTMRSDSDFVPQPYRHGGLAVVDGSQEVRSVPLPAECGSYVYPVHRLSDGTLVALTAAMREDTADGERRTPQLSNVRYIRSTDGGASWTSSAPLFYTGEWVPCTGKVIDLGGGYVLGVMPGSVVVSTDGGRTWDFDERVPASMRAIDIHLSGNNLLVAAHDGLYRINSVTSVDGETPALQLRREPVAMSRQSFRAHVSTLDAATVYDMGGRVLCTSQDCESIDRMPLPLGSVVMVVSTSERRMYYVE
jgi:hypothetical protein